MKQLENIINQKWNLANIFLINKFGLNKHEGNNNKRMQNNTILVYFKAQLHFSSPSLSSVLDLVPQ